MGEESSQQQSSTKETLESGEPMERRFFREDLDGKVSHFQIVDLGSSVYVWASSLTAMNNLALAMPTPKFGPPSTTQLLAGDGADTAERVAKRLSLRIGRPVAVSWNIEGDDIQHLWAEKQILQELATDLASSASRLTL